MKTDRSQFFFWGVETGRRLYVRSCGDFILVPPDREMIRRVDFGEIFWPIAGHCRFLAGGREAILRPGYVWYYPPGALHEYQPLDAFHYCFLTVAGEHAANMFELLDIRPGLNRAGTCPHPLFTSLCNELTEHTVRHRVNAAATAFRILAEVAVRPRKNNDFQNSMLEARNRIDTDFGDPDLSVNTLAEDYHMHRGSFSRAFHKAFDMTVSDYMVMVRLKNAIDMLSTTDLPVKTVSVECGFRSANYFAKVFLAKVGMTPKDYRLRKYSRKNLPVSFPDSLANQQKSGPGRRF